VIAARNRALELRRKVHEGIDPLEERQQDRTQPTLKDLCMAYLEHHALVHKRPHSVRDDKQMIAGIITPRMGTLRISAVSRQGVEQLHASLKPTPYLANRVLALLSKMFSLAIEWHWVSSNPAQGIPRFHEDRRERCRCAHTISEHRYSEGNRRISQQNRVGPKGSESVHERSSNSDSP
jgi:hypothetical protein